MTNRHAAIRGAASICAGLLLLAIFISAVHSADDSPASKILIDNATTGYYNSSIGTRLDGVLPWFPEANAHPDPTLKPAPEPDPIELTFKANLGALFAENPLPLGSNWSGEQSIPRGWARNTETAIIYEIETDKGVKGLTGSFGVDNGIYVWVDGRYKFGAMEPGGASLLEYPNIPLDDLGPGKHYVQILREDHGAATGYAIEVKGTEVTSDTVTFGRASGPGVTYNDRPQPDGQEFIVETCPPNNVSTSQPCSPVVRIAPQQNDEYAKILASTIWMYCADSTGMGQLFLEMFLKNYQDPESDVYGDVDLAIWFAQLRVQDLCTPSDSRDGDDPRFLIGLEHGAALFSTSLTAQTISLDVQLARVDAEGPVTFVAGYAPNAEEAIFLAFSGPITLTPVTGAPLILAAGQRVTLMAGGFGEIEELPQLYLPAISR